jgi:ribonuclease R
VIENAFTLEKTSAGNWRLGFHIADICHLIQPDEALDREALKRGRSVYLGELVLSMLPEVVAERCGLLPGSDRLALSFLITVDSKSGVVLEWEIQPSVVKVDLSLSEQQAEAILSNQKSENSAQVVEIVQQLASLQQLLRQVRLGRGSLQLNLPPNQNPYYDEGALGCVVTNDLPVHSLLTEFVLLVNQLTATHLNALGIPAIWRTQGAPDTEDVQEMLKLAINLGIELTLEPEIDIQPLDYQQLTRVFAESPSEQVLTYLLQDTLKPATYSITKGPHFGLALAEYTQFTAPLRRYPDLLMQRVFYTLLEHGRDRRNTRVKERVNLRHSSSHGEINWNVLPPELQQELQSDLMRVIVQLNDREKEVQEAEADLAGLQRASLMKQRIGEVFTGVITGVQSYGFFVEIEVPPAESNTVGNPRVPLRVEGLVHVSSLKDDWYEYRARQQALFGRKNRASYRLGDRVAVQVKSVDYYRQQIDLVTVGSDGAVFGKDVSIPNRDDSDLYLAHDEDMEPDDLEQYAEDE